MTTPTTLFVSTIVIQDDKVLMIQEGKNHLGQRDKWNFPAGRVELDETIQEAAVRETKEETGYDVKIDNIISILKEDLDDSMALVVFFAGSLVSDAPDNHEDGIQDVKFVLIDEMINLDLRYPDLYNIAKKAQRGKKYPLEVLSGSEIK